jgi:hypothetical protein
MSKPLQVPEIEHNTRSVIFSMICKWDGLDAAITWAMFGSYEDDISLERVDELLDYFKGDDDEQVGSN